MLYIINCESECDARVRNHLRRVNVRELYSSAEAKHLRLHTELHVVQHLHTALLPHRFSGEMPTRQQLDAHGFDAVQPIDRWPYNGPMPTAEAHAAQTRAWYTDHFLEQYRRSLVSTAIVAGREAIEALLPLLIRDDAKLREVRATMRDGSVYECASNGFEPVWNREL